MNNIVFSAFLDMYQYLFQFFDKFTNLTYLLHCHAGFNKIFLQSYMLLFMGKMVTLFWAHFILIPRFTITSGTLFFKIMELVKDCIITGSSRYPKVELSSESFSKPKWYKVKKQLP